MHVLVTRPEAETRALRERLEAAGHAVTVEPLLEVELLAPSPALATPFGSRAEPHIQGLIVTSRNGVRALAAMPDVEALHAVPLFAVGPGTAAAAREAGFTTVTAGPSSARELAQVVAAACDPAAGKFLYFTGETVAYDLKTDLSARGFDVHRHVVYRTKPRDSLTPATADALGTGTIDAVLLMSPSTADAYVSLIAAHGLRDRVKNVVHLCLSTNISARLKPLSCIRKVIAIQPNMEVMLALVATVAAQSQVKS